MVALEQPGCQKVPATGTTSKSTHLNNGVNGVGRGPLSLLRRLAQDVSVQLLAVLPLAVPVPLRAPLVRGADTHGTEGASPPSCRTGLGLLFRGSEVLMG